MMPPNVTKLMTVEEYKNIADPPGGRYELHHGELVFVSFPVNPHAHIQRELMLILNRICAGWYVSIEFAFRPLAEYEVWAADVAMVTKERFRASPKKGWLAGSPDLVIEVLSPSNTANEMRDKERTCFQGGCREFWVVDPDLRTIRVITPDGSERTYAIGEEVPLDRFVPAKLVVAEVFAE